MRIIKISSRIYQVKNSEDEVLYTIKRIHSDRYTVRKEATNDTLTFCSLQDAKKYVRAERRETWIEFFRRHTSGRTFENQDASNENMRTLAEMWSALSSRGATGHQGSS